MFSAHNVYNDILSDIGYDYLYRSHSRCRQGFRLYTNRSWTIRNYKSHAKWMHIHL